MAVSNSQLPKYAQFISCEWNKWLSVANETELVLSDKATDSAVFELELQESGQVAVKSKKTNLYIRLLEFGGRKFVADAEKVLSGDHQFNINNLGDSKIAFEGRCERFLGANNDQASVEYERNSRIIWKMQSLSEAPVPASAAPPTASPSPKSSCSVALRQEAKTAVVNAPKVALSKEVTRTIDDLPKYASLKSLDRGTWLTVDVATKQLTLRPFDRSENQIFKLELQNGNVTVKSVALDTYITFNDFGERKFICTKAQVLSGDDVFKINFHGDWKVSLESRGERFLASKDNTIIVEYSQNPNCIWEVQKSDYSPPVTVSATKVNTKPSTTTAKPGVAKVGPGQASPGGPAPPPPPSMPFGSASANIPKPKVAVPSSCQGYSRPLTGVARSDRATAGLWNYIEADEIQENYIQHILDFIADGADLHATRTVNPSYGLHKGYHLEGECTIAGRLISSSRSDLEELLYILVHLAKIDVNCIGEKRLQYPLIMCAFSSIALKYLIENKANLDVRDNQGNTPLHHLASKCSDMSAIRFLLDQGQLWNTTNNKGQTVSDVAASLSTKMELAKYGAPKPTPREPVYRDDSSDDDDDKCGCCRGKGQIGCKLHFKTAKYCKDCARGPITCPQCKGKGKC